jgi:hypothetical protein
VTSGKWRDSTGLIWTCTKVEGDVVVLERTQIVINGRCSDDGYRVDEVPVKVVVTLKRLSSQYKRVE